MAYNLRFWYEYKDIADTLNRVEILYNGYVGDSYEVIAGSTPFVPSINEGEGNKGGEIIDTLFSLQAVTSSQFNIEAFDSEAYGDVIFKYYHDSVLKYHGVIDAFETNQELLPNGTTVLILSAESGIKNLGKVYLKNSDDTAISGKVRIIEVIAKALRLLNAQNTANIVSIVNTSVYEGSTQVNADKDLFENITNIETFQNDNGEILTAYEAIKRCLGGIYTLKYFENQWYIEHIEAYTQASYYKTVYDYSGTRISRTSVTRTLKNIFEGDILRGGTEGKLFSKGKIVVKRNINSLISSLPNSDFEPIGSQLVHWTGVSSLSNSILGGYGTVDQPFYLQINGSVYDNTTPDTEFVESGSFNWYPYGRSDFANRSDANMYDEDEKLKFNLKNEYGSGISGARVQIMATYAFMDEDTQMPTMTPGTEEDISFTTFTYYYTNNGWSLDPGFYVTGNNAIESIEVDPPAVNRMGYFRYRSANTGTYYLKSPPTVSVKIRLFRGARLKIGASTNEESGYTYFVRYFRVTSSVWTQDEEILQSKVEKTYLTANNTDRLGNVDIGLDMYYPLYPYAFGSIFKDSSTNTPISGYKKPGESTIQAYDLFVGQSYLRRNSSRLHRMYIIKKSFDVSPDTLLTYDSKVYRIVKYDFNQRYGNCDMTILEVANNGVAISEKVSVSENQTVLDSSYKKVIYPPKAGDDRIKVDKYGNISLNPELNNITSFNKSGGYINLQKEDNEESSGVYFTNADGTMAQAMTPSAIGFDFKSDLNNFKVELDLSELTKDVKVATDDSAWMLGGNDLVTKAFIGGKAGNFDLGVKRNNIEVATFVSSGLSLPQMAAVTTDTDKFVVNDSGVLKYQSGANVLKHITDALTAGYIPKADATLGLTNSILYSASNGVAIGTTTPDQWSQGGTGSYLTVKSAESRLQLVSSGTAAAMIGGGNETIRRGAIWFSDGSNIDFYTNSSNSGTTATNKLRINASGSVGIGTTSLTGRSLSISKDITGAVTSYAVLNNGTIKSDVTTSVRLFQTSLNTEAATFTIPTIYHFLALQNSIGAGSSITSQIGFYVDASLVGAANNYGFRGVMSAASGRWNNYHDGTAQNWFAGNTGIGYGRSVPATALDVNGQVSVSLGSASAPAYTFFGDLNNGWFSPTADTQAWSVGGSEVMRLSSAGSLGIGTTSLTGINLAIAKNITGNTVGYGIDINSVAQTDVTNTARYIRTLVSNASGGSMTDITHIYLGQGTLNSVTNQTGFWITSTLTGATNNYGIRNQVASGTGRWGLYFDGSVQNYIRGNLGIGVGSTVPATELEVRGAISTSLGSTSAPAYTFVGDTNNGWYSPTADTQGWVLNGSEAMRLNSTGLGIGVTPVYKLDVNGTGHFTGAVTFDTVPSSLQDATSANHLVRYSQWISSTAVKYLPTAVKTVSLSNITLSGTQTVSGVALIAGDRILVAGQTTQSENGIYVVAAGAWSRATDSDTDTELRGFIVSVSNGTYGGYKYINTNQSTITVGTTAVTYAEFSNLAEIDPVFIAWRDLSRTANTVLATPNGSAGAASFRSLVTADISNLNSYSSFSNYTSTTDLNTLLSGKSDTSHTHSFNSLTSIPTTVAGYGLTINTSDITGLSSYTGFSGYTTTIALNTLLAGYSTTSHTHAFSEITSTPTTATGYGIVLVSSDIPSLDWSKITTGKPTTLSGYGITDAQSVLNGTGYVKMSGTTLSYINKEFVDTTTDQTIYGQKIFRDSFKVGNSLFNIQTGQPDTVDNDLKFDFITDATSFNYSISDIDDNIGTLFSIQGNFVGTNIRTDISTDLYIYRIVDSNLSTGTNKQILRTDSSGILNWTTIDGSYISNWATKQDALNGTGFVKANGTTITYDNSTYLSTSVAATTYQPLDADLTSISALTGDGVLRKVSNVWNLDTDMYLTTDTKIYFIATATHVGLVNPGTTLTVNGLGNLNLKSGIVTTGTYRSVTVDTYGRVTAGTNPTTVVGYGLTDVWTKTESDARYLLQSSYNPTWGQLTGSPIDNTAFNSTMLGYVNTSTTQTGIAGSKTFTSAMYANGTLTTNQLFVKDTTGGNAYPLSIVNALTYNGWSGSSLIKSGLDIYNDYKPLVFLGSHFMMLRGSLKLGGNSVGATGTVDFATERLDITGNIRYSGTLKPSNIAGTGWLYSNGTNDSWKLITPSDIFELSSFTGFDSRYYTKTEISDIIASTIPNGTSGHFLTHNSDGDLVFMNIDIDPVRLSSNKIAVGSPQGILTEVSGFEFVDKRYLSISRKGFADQKITIGHLPNSQHALFDVQGGRMELNSNVGIRLNPLAGTGTRMLVVNATGDISAQDIPSGGSGSNYLPYRRVPYGSAENTQTSDDSLRFYSSVLESELKLGISTPLSFRSDNTGYNNYIQSIGGYINMSSNRISLLVSASGQPNSGEIELSSYHNTLIHSGYGDVIINATEGDVIIKGGAVEWVTTTINGQTRQILCKKL